MNKHIKSKKFIIFSLVFSLLLFMGVFFAKATTKKEFLEQRIKQKCSLVTSRVELIITRYDNNKERHIKRYKKAIERLKNANQKLKELGCNTSKVESDYQKLNSMIIEFAKEYNAFIEYLRNTQNYICGESHGDYLKSLNQARNQLMVARQISLNARNFYQSTIRKDLLGLKETCRIETTTSPTPTSTTK